MDKLLGSEVDISDLKGEFHQIRFSSLCNTREPRKASLVPMKVKESNQHSAFLGCSKITYMQIHPH